MELLLKEAHIGSMVIEQVKNVSKRPWSSLKREIITIVEETVLTTALRSMGLDARSTVDQEVAP